jgi:uncharacterized protein (UPF0264 family)
VRLLVSVRDAEEATAALAGGADIVDAKDPAEGALGPVLPAVLAAIHAALPDGIPLSAALGDVASTDDVAGALGRLELPLAFVKVGFRAISGAGAVEQLLANAVRRAERLPDRPAIIAVAYADWRRVGSLPPAAFPDRIGAAGAAGLLVDTFHKDGPALPDLLTPDDLMGLGAELEELGLSYALGGSLGRGDVPLVRAAGAGILGVRGAVCVGGRTGRVDLELVRALAVAVGRGAGEPRVGR